MTNPICCRHIIHQTSKSIFNLYFDTLLFQNVVKFISLQLLTSSHNTVLKNRLVYILFFISFLFYQIWNYNLIYRLLKQPKPSNMAVMLTVYQHVIQNNMPSDLLNLLIRQLNKFIPMSDIKFYLLKSQNK